MTKLTTERLDKLQDNLLQFQDAYSDPADKENYDIFVDALHVLNEFKAAKEKLLAYEQAAKNPVAWVATDSEGFPEYNSHNEFSADCGAGTPLYAAPVLPKQPDGTLIDEDTKPEQTEREKRILNLIHDNNLSWEILFSQLEEAKGRINRLYKLPDDLDFDCEFENGDYGSDEEPWLRGRVAGFNEALQVIKRSHNAEKTSTAQPVSEHSAAIKDVIAERQRQIREEGWTPELDDRYSSGELAGAAACYARYTNARGWVFPTNPSDYQSAEEPSDWPWAAEWWKPTNPRRDLVKAGALILAEIERQDRAAPAQESE